MMKKTLTAIYEQGVFRPLEAPDLTEQQRVMLIVSVVSPSGPVARFSQTA
jgi:predicted DNA-binding antitoxin AbrB/MazE fold protein